jgi:GAF domain-containing protein
VLKPIPQTVEAARELGRYQPDFDVLGYLQETADKVQALVPDCVGMSLAWVDHGVTFTLVASDAEIAVLDAVQYLAGGPCVEGVERQQGLAVNKEELLDEERWRLFGDATAAKGVMSTLTLPLLEHGTVVGSANLYGASAHAFDDHHEEIAELLGARVSDIVRNADLSFSTRRAAERAPEALRAQHSVDQAVGMIVASMRVDADTAVQRLLEASERAGISAEQFARALVNLRHRPGRADEAS